MLRVAAVLVLALSAVWLVGVVLARVRAAAAAAGPPRRRDVAS